MLNVKKISPLLKCFRCEWSAYTHGDWVWILYIVLLRPNCPYNTCPRIQTLVLCQVIFTMPILLFGSEVKASACKAGDRGSIPGWRRSPREGNGNPLQYSCLENPMDRGAWWATVHRVPKSQTRLSDFTFTSSKSKRSQILIIRLSQYPILMITYKCKEHLIKSSLL